MNFRTRPALLALAAGAIVVVGLEAAAPAHPSYLTAWIARYPNSTLPARIQTANGSQCYVCHQPPNTSTAGNCYRTALSARITAGRTIEQALADIENADSDNDGVSNLVEINTPRTDMPGQIGYMPGLIGPTGTDPCGPSPTQAVTNQPETPAPVCYANCDGSSGVPLLTVNDFVCFQTLFASGSTNANCDGSSGVPLLTVNDFVCFQTRFAAGCP